MTVQIIIVDDHPATRMGIHLLLDFTPDIQVMAEADCGIQALELVSTLKPDVVLLDFRLPDIFGPQVTTKIRELGLRTRVLGYSAFSDEDYIFEMLDAGAQGYILKTESPDMLIDAIRTIARGETWISPSIANKVLIHTRKDLKSYSSLSHRELEVLKLLAMGYSNNQIAKTLVISKATVKNHLTNIYKTLGVGSRAQAIIWACSTGHSALDRIYI